LLLLFLLFDELPLHSSMFLLPVVVLIQTVFLYGLTLLLGSLNVLYRDIQHLVGSLLTFLFFLCPILYPVSSVPERFRFTLEYNPFARLIELYQSILYYGTVPPLSHWLIMIFLSLGIFVVGSMVYDRHRETFAELL
jgi:ABC-type polysaccharide/polyol phosphate export permease